MKPLHYLSIFNHNCKMALVILTCVMSSFHISAASPEKYSSSSVLSKGNWVKIDISTPGLQTLTRQTLKNFGFNDPNTVHVYGYGGRIISEILHTDHPDDLPPVPVVRKSDGSITFYAAGIIAPTPATSKGMTYDHTINPYGETSYYFLSDVAPSESTPIIDLSETTGNTAETFTSQLVHERDLLQCATSGRDYLGEDFRQNKSQTFNFDLPDNSDGRARIRVRFGANATAQSSFIVSANGTRLAATTDDRIAQVTTGDQFYKLATTIKSAEGIGNSLAVGIEYSQAGVVSCARLDWIEVEYERTLALRDSRLYFTVNPSIPTTYKISGASENTIIWDVTEPWAIKEVKGNFNPSDRTLSISLKDPGLREFMTFEPSVTGANVPGRFKTANQDIHGLPTPDMVIITPDEFASAAEKIARLHREHDGMTVHVLSPEKIYNEFSSGNADVSAFRKLLKMWYDRSEEQESGRTFGYCLLMGRPTYDQKVKNPETIKSGYPRTLIWQSPTVNSGPTETNSFGTDDFIAMLEDETSERSMSLRKQLVGVGRYTVTSIYEAEAVASKLEEYMTTQHYGTWRNNVMMIADDGDTAQHLTQAQSAISNMMSTPSGRHLAYERIYLDAYDRKQTSTGLTFPEARQRMLMKWQKEGSSLISYIGHANSKEWSHEKLLTWNDVINMSNQYLPVLYAATCSFGKWDDFDVSGAETLLTNPAGGAIAVITPSRTVYINRNGYITNSITREMASKGPDGKGQRLGDIMRLGKNRSADPDENMLRYHLFGDPALRMPLSTHTVSIDSIAGQPLATVQADAPVIKARSTVRISGTIKDHEGNDVAFNGPVQLTLFDGEISVTTHGWGDKGKVEVYQDRSAKLATAITNATDGRWAVNLLMPAEISNNFSPALLSIYAYDEALKLEANGSTEMIYVYGYNSDAAEDTEGPVIESFTVGSASGIVHSSPVAMAVFSDESGINISDAGIGHKMSLRLDNGKIFDDVSQFFLPDATDETKGSIAYPLADLAPGEHKLTLTVWDNANNSSSETVSFKVGLNMRPTVNELTSYYDRDNDRLSVRLNTDRALCTLTCRLECFDLLGNMVWSQERKAYSGSDSCFTFDWNIKDSNGNRLPRGIYSLRATVTSTDGLSSSNSKKIAIPSK